MTREPPHQVLQKIRAVLLANGGIYKLQKVFAKCDRNGNSTLDRQEIQWGLKEAGIVLSPSEFERVFKFFDKNNDGVVSFPEFVGAIRGPLSNSKANTINAIADKYFTTSDPVDI